MQQYIINARSVDPIFVVVFVFFFAKLLMLVVLFLDMRVCVIVCLSVWHVWVILSIHLCIGSKGCRFHAYPTTIVILLRCTLYNVHVCVIY